MRSCFFILFLFSSTLVSSQDVENLKNEVEKILEFDYNLNFEENEGLWIGVIDEDSTFVFSIGNIDPDSLKNFQVGSISKLLTADLISKRLIKKNIATSTKISSYLDLHQSYGQITIDDLINHQSNLPKDPYFFGKHNKNPDNPYETYSDELIIPELNKYQDFYKVEKDKKFNYGNVNYALLGLLAEKIENKKYCHLIQEMYGSTYPSMQCSDDSMALSVGFNKSGSIGSPWTFAGFAASEGLSMNIIDLTNYMRSELNKISTFEPIKISKSLSFEAPWYVIKQKRNRKVYSFSGTTSIHSVFVCINKENKTAVVMMRNSGKGILHLPLAILSMVDDRKKKNK